MLIDFCIAFSSFLVPFWEPSWGPVGHICAQNGGRGVGKRPFFVGSMLFFDFLVDLDSSGSIWRRFWKVWACILEVFGLHFEGLWLRFASHVAFNIGTF